MDKEHKVISEKGFGRMELLRKVSEFCGYKDRLHIYKTFVRSVLEKSCVVWHSSLTLKNTNDLERVQRAAVKIITSGKYSYQEGLTFLNLPTLKERRETLTVKFAKKCLTNKKTRGMFKNNHKKHFMKLRYSKQFKEENIKTKRLYNSAIPYIQRILNKDHREKQNIIRRYKN